MKPRKLLVLIIVSLLLLLTIGIFRLSVRASPTDGTIRIKSDGSVEPWNAPIIRDGNIYFLTDDIKTSEEVAIVVEKDNIILDGKGHLLKGSGVGYGIKMYNVKETKVMNMRILGFTWGICLNNSNNNEMSGNIIENNKYGIYFYLCRHNKIVRNSIENNEYGLYFDFSHNNIIYHNNFINNFHNFGIYTFIYICSDANTWDDGSKGNYWSEYRGVDANNDGIIDTSYVLVRDSCEKDNYPLARPYERFFVTVSTPYGTATGSGWYMLESTATVSISQAFIDHGNGTRRVFKGWYENDSLMSDRPSFSMSMYRNVSLVARWGKEYRIKVSSDWEARGSGWYEAGSTAIISIDQRIVDHRNGTRRVFGCWCEAGSTISREQSFLITVDRPREIVVSWDTEYEVSVSTPYGYTTGSGWYKRGSTTEVSISQMTIEGKGMRGEFKGWFEGNNMISEEQSLNVTVNRPMKIVAGWDVEVEVNVLTPYGTATGSGWYEVGSTSTVLITPTVIEKDFLTDLVFEGWRVNGSIVSTLPTYSFTVDKPVNLVASWRTETNLARVGLMVAALLIVVVLAIPLISKAIKRKRKRTKIYD